MDTPNNAPLTVSPEPQGGVGGKVAIAIIVIVLLVAALYYFNSKRTPNEVPSQNTSATSEDLNKELDAAATTNIEADLKKIEDEFN